MTEYEEGRHQRNAFRGSVDMDPCYGENNNFWRWEE